MFGGEGKIGKSEDKGKTWEIKDLYDTGMYFYKVLFDEDNPHILYASGPYSDRKNEVIYVYRSTDMGDSWHLAYRESLGSNCGEMIDMVKCRNKFVFYTRDCGLFELDLNTTSVLSNQTIAWMSDVIVSPNPVRSTLHFETDATILKVEIIDSEGHILQTTAIYENEKTIIIPKLNKGIYFAVFHTDRRKITRKIWIDN